MTVRKSSAVVPVSAEFLEDTHDLVSIVTVEAVKPPAPGRYRRVWDSGYWAAVSDFREGRLIVIDGAIRAGAWLSAARGWH